MKIAGDACQKRPDRSNWTFGYKECETLLPFALDLTTCRLVLLKASAYLTDPGCKIGDLLLDEVIREHSDSSSNVFSELNIVASLFGDILRHSGRRYSQHLRDIFLRYSTFNQLARNSSPDARQHVPYYPFTR
jgi:hypothetical protein